MSDAAAPVFRVAARVGQRLVLRSDAPARVELIVIGGFRGSPWPDRVTRPELFAGETAGVWQLHCVEGRFDFQALAVDRIQLREELYAPLHERFAMSAIDRLAIRLLLWLLRFPGGARVLHWWHRSR